MFYFSFTFLYYIYNIVLYYYIILTHIKCCLMEQEHNPYSAEK